MLCSSSVKKIGHLGAQWDRRKFSLDIHKVKLKDHLLARRRLSKECVPWARVGAKKGMVWFQILVAPQDCQCCLFRKYRFQLHIRSTESKSSSVGLENLLFF